MFCLLFLFGPSDFLWEPDESPCDPLYSWCHRMPKNVQKLRPLTDCFLLSIVYYSIGLQANGITERTLATLFDYCQIAKLEPVRIYPEVFASQ